MVKMELTDIAIKKKEFRKKAILKRAAIDSISRDKWNKSIYEYVINNRFYIEGTVVFMYASAPDEADTIKLIEHALLNNKRVALPRVLADGVMEFFYIASLSDLTSGYKGILEPGGHCQRAELTDTNLLLVPGVAFDRNGNRMGYGKGFYDRFLSKAENVYKLALCYSLQLYDELPTEANDVPMDMIITDNEIWTREKNS